MLRSALVIGKAVKPSPLAMCKRPAPRASLPTSTYSAPARTVTTAARERPLSPHLTIYKMRVNAITSVFFRGTGIALFGGLALFSLGYLPSGKKLTAHLYCLQQYPILNALVKFGVVTPLTYHYLGGLRHLAWDSVVGHDMKFVKTTGWGATAIAGAAGVIAMFTTCRAEEK